MTAVAPPPNVPRPWSAGSQHSLDSAGSDAFLPRPNRAATQPQQRYANAMPSSVSENGASNNSAWNTGGSLGGKKKGGLRNGAATNGEVWGKPGINGGPQRPGSAGSQTNGVHGGNAPMLPSQQLMNAQNGGGQQQQPQMQSYLMLLPLNGTFDRKQIPLPFYPETLRIGRQTNAKTQPMPNNGFFDSKVLSRQHAEIWADKQTGKVWIRDIKSSNGTFVNGQRLSQENQESEPHGLNAEDVLELGIDIVGEDNKTIVHRKVAARVEHAGLHGGNFDLDFSGDGLAGQLPPNHPNAQGSLRNRNGAGARGAGGAVAMQHRFPPMPVMPTITLEMVVKKLNAELQCAKQQSHDLHRTAELFDRLLTSAPADPPAPTTTSSASSDSSAASDSPDQNHLLSLVSALEQAKAEMHAKAALVSTLEAALERERLAREHAEARAAELEAAAKNPPQLDPAAHAAAEAAALHQKRLAEMMQDLQDTRERMEAYRLRAETAERERDAERCRLEEMIRGLREERREVAIQTEVEEEDVEEGEGEAEAEGGEKEEVAVEGEKSGAKEEKPGRVRRRRENAEAVKRGRKRSLRGQEVGLQVGKRAGGEGWREGVLPYGAVLGVVILGVGLMSVLNSWQRGER